MADLSELADRVEPEEDEKFREWIRELDEDVIQADYGYERGEFNIMPSLWYPQYVEGLTPAAAFKRALDAFHAEQEERDRLKAENWARIQAEDGS